MIEVGPWPKYPLLYEINTWVWLAELSANSGRSITLDEVPQVELERIASLGFDGIWLMGVWQRSPGAQTVSQTVPEMQPEYHRALPDYTVEDIVGSPYAVGNYRVDGTLGGDDGLAAIRRRMGDHGLRLMLDFVPNHLAIDHPWLQTQPHRFVQGDSERLAAEPTNYFSTTIGGRPLIFAHGRDPFFAGWSDTVQLDYRHPETRKAMRDQLLAIDERCDGVRCDMAMLLLHEIFAGTWGGAFDPPRAEFWPAAITDVKAQYPDFLFLAEVYWDMEWELQQQGFDYTYDKRLYDRLIDGDAAGVQAHLAAGMDYQQHLARFIENHDEPRAAAALGVARSKAAAVLSLTLPGLRLLHDGQCVGKRIKLPVQLGRRRPEEPVPELESFYTRLLPILAQPIFHDGHWQVLVPQPAEPDDMDYQSAVAHQWTYGGVCRVVVVNLSDREIRFRLAIDRPRLAGHNWLLRDDMNETTYRRDGNELLYPGLYVVLEPYGYHFFDIKENGGDE